MFNLGSIHEEKQQITEAMRWYRLAEQAGVAEASKKIESLKGQAVGP
jgi:TPR repeat protein